MPRKKSTDSITRAEDLSGAEQALPEEQKVMPKAARKPARKKKVEAEAEAEAPTEQSAAVEISEQTITVHESKVVIEPEPEQPTAEPVEFIAPRPVEPDLSASARMDGVKPNPKQDFAAINPGDPSFLAPETFSFGLKDRLNRRKPKTALTILYFLSGVIVLSALAIILLTFYTAHKLNEKSPVVSNSSSSAASSAPALKKFGIVAAASQQAFLNSAMQQNSAISSTLTADTSTSLTSSVPTGSTDTLYVKTNGSNNQAVLDFLNKNGLQPQVTQKSDLPDDFVLYLAPTDTNVNLAGLTAAAYNGNGKAGMAKQYCQYLAAYHAASCSPLNANAATGLTIATKEPYLILTLGRAPQFQNATFTAAVAGQVEDIRVIIGK